MLTNSLFAGKPRAVYIDAKGLPSESMQKIAKEMNLSETTFILPAGNLPQNY